LSSLAFPENRRVLSATRIAENRKCPSLYADVEYFGKIYLDAELMDGVWFFENMFGGVYPFVHNAG
jgi:hypothetical protein